MNGIYTGWPGWRKPQKSDKRRFLVFDADESIIAFGERQGTHSRRNKSILSLRNGHKIHNNPLMLQLGGRRSQVRFGSVE
jgi:hypothetical protein